MLLKRMCVHFISRPKCLKAWQTIQVHVTLVVYHPHKQHVSRQRPGKQELTRMSV